MKYQLRSRNSRPIRAIIKTPEQKLVGRDDNGRLKGTYDPKC